MVDIESVEVIVDWPECQANADHCHTWIDAIEEAKQTVKDMGRDPFYYEAIRTTPHHYRVRVAVRSNNG